MARDPSLFALFPLTALVTGACTLSDPDPIPVVPPTPVLLAEALREGTLAIVDFVDDRPEVERRPGGMQDTFIDSRLLPPGHYWYDRGETTHSLPGGSVDGRELYLRMTGDGSFLWYPFPYAGTGGPRPRGASRGLSDYFALTVERRGVVSKVIRLRSRQEARAAGADFLLEGRVAHFAAGMTEAHEERIERPDDVHETRLFSRLGLALTLTQLDDGHVLWERAFLEPLEPEDPVHIFDWTEDYRGVATGVGGPKLLRLDAEHQPRMSFEDMVAHMNRRLQEVATRSVADIESALRQNFPID